MRRKALILCTALLLAFAAAPERAARSRGTGHRDRRRAAGRRHRRRGRERFGHSRQRRPHHRCRPARARAGAAGRDGRERGRQDRHPRPRRCALPSQSARRRHAEAAAGRAQLGRDDHPHDRQRQAGNHARVCRRARRASSRRRACTRAGQGFNLTGPYPGAPTLKPTTPEEARKGVQAHKALKVDFIKIWMGDKGFTPDVVAAIVDEAKKQNIPVVAHIGNVAQVKQLAELGVTDFMHEARDGMNPEFIAYAKAKGLSFAPTLGQGQSRWYYYEHPEFLTMDPKFDGFYARGRAMLNDPARRQEIIGAADFAAAEAALQGQQLSVHQNDVRRRHPHRHRHRLRRRGVADDSGGPHDTSRSADVRRGGHDAGRTRFAPRRSMRRACSSAPKIRATDRSRPARSPISSC